MLRVAVPASGALLAAESEAQVVFAVDQQFTATQQSSSGELLYIDVDGQSHSFTASLDPAAELVVQFPLFSNSLKPAVSATASSQGNIFQVGNFAGNVPAGTLIDSVLMTGISNNTGAIWLNNTGQNDANWAAGTRGYVGFNFISSETTFFGYMDITYTSDNHLYVGSVGYQEGGILAGAAAVPEPSSFAALAGLLAGSAALLRRRERRRAAIAA